MHRQASRIIRWTTLVAVLLGILIVLPTIAAARPAPASGQAAISSPQGGSPGGGGGKDASDPEDIGIYKAPPTRGPSDMVGTGGDRSARSQDQPSGWGLFWTRLFLVTRFGIF